MKTTEMVKKCLLLPLLAAAFIACSDDDDNNGGNNEGKETASFTYEFKTNQTVLDMADVTIRYMDTDSTQYEEILTDTVWTKTLTADHWDAIAAFQVEWKLKADFEAEEEKEYEIANAYICSAKALKGEGVFSSETHNLNGSMTIKGDKLVEFFADGIACSHADRIDAAGNVTDTEITWNEDEEQAPSQGEEETPETPGQE